MTEFLYMMSAFFIGVVIVICVYSRRLADNHIMLRRDLINSRKDLGILIKILDCPIRHIDRSTLTNNIYREWIRGIEDPIITELVDDCRIYVELHFGPPIFFEGCKHLLLLWGETPEQRASFPFGLTTIKEFLDSVPNNKKYLCKQINGGHNKDNDKLKSKFLKSFIEFEKLSKWKEENNRSGEEANECRESTWRNLHQNGCNPLWHIISLRP